MPIPRQISRELACLVAFRNARAGFFRRLVAQAEDAAPPARREPDGSLKREYVALLRSDAAAQIAEFYFVLRELGLDEGRGFRRYVENHNKAMRGHLGDAQQARRLGLARHKIEAAIFSEEQIRFIETVSPQGALLMDQSALGRLLIELMAPETCRKIVIAFAEAALLERQTIGHALIRSTGRLEEHYASQMAEILKATDAGLGSGLGTGLGSGQ